MADPVDLLANAIHLSGVDLGPVHGAAKAALEYVQRFNRVADGSVAATISGNREMATIAPMLHSVSGLRRELEKIGDGNFPENLYFDGSTKDAASALLLLSESAKSIPSRINGFCKSDIFGRLDDESTMLGEAVDLLSKSAVLDDEQLKSLRESLPVDTATYPSAIEDVGQAKAPNAKSKNEKPTASTAGQDDNAWLSIGSLLKKFEVPESRKKALEKRLERFRGRNFEKWQEVENPRPNKPRYLYLAGAVKHILLDLSKES